MKIVLGVTGGIAAYKAAEVLRLLQDRGVRVQVVMTAAAQELHVILDNYGTHKKCDGWLAEHPHVHFHFTPTSASWLNQVEIWFGLLSRKALRGLSTKSTAELRQAIEAFIAAYAENAKPFKWRKREVRGSQLRNTIVNIRN